MWTTSSKTSTGRLPPPAADKRRRLPFAALLSAALTGCATPPAQENFAEASRSCAAYMYGARALEGRASPRWHYYDYCMARRGYR